MNIKKINLLLPLLFLLCLSGCNSITKMPVSLGHHDMCLSEPVAEKGIFYATGSATLLEQAKANARQDLVLQISSEVSAKTQSLVTDNQGVVKSQSSSAIQSKSSSVPIDQHKIVQTCKSGEMYYVAISLSQSSLINATRQRLNKVSKDSQKILNTVGRASRYKKYMSRQVLQKNLFSINTYTQILSEYANKPVSKKTEKLIKKLETFLENSSRLLIGIEVDANIMPLQDVLEQALNKANLDYRQGTKNTVAVIKLKSRENKKRSGKRYIIKINASVDVNRGDTGKLLSRHDLGKVVATSTVSYDLALQNAQRDLQIRLRRYLNGDANKIKKALGLVDNGLVEK